jgi:hypothetical protein
MADLCSIVENSETPCCMAEGDVTLPTICLNDLIPTGEPHEPPMGFEDGSLRLTWKHEIVERNDSPVPNDPRPRKYVLGESGRIFGPVAVVRVLTERGGNEPQHGGTVGFKRYIVPRNKRARLLIWLHQLNRASNETNFDYEPKSSEPQILIKGEDLLVETDRQLRGKYQTYKPNRQFGYEHPGFARHFRIAAWAIVDEHGSTITENDDAFGESFSDVNQDGYKIHVSFHD